VSAFRNCSVILEVLLVLGVKQTNYRQVTTREIAERLGPFDYGQSPEDGINRVLRDENVELEEGKQYRGEW
jgi:hypothetical protein